MRARIGMIAAAFATVALVSAPTAADAASKTWGELNVHDGGTLRGQAHGTASTTTVHLRNASVYSGTSYEPSRVETSWYFHEDVQDPDGSYHTSWEYEGRADTPNAASTSVHSSTVQISSTTRPKAAPNRGSACRSPGAFPCRVRRPLFSRSLIDNSVTTALVVDAVGRRYGRRRAIDGISFEWDAGALGIAGANGSGKSTLLGLCSGVIRPTSGSVTIATDGVASPPSSARVGFVPQSFGFPGSLRIGDMVSYAAWLQGVPQPRFASRDALAAVDLAGDAQVPLGKASGGMVRRAGIAAALVSRPDILILDEPSAGVDVGQRATLRALLRRQADERLVLLSSHLGDDFTEVCTGLLVLDRGRRVFEGAPGEALRVTGATSLEAAIVALPRIGKRAS
jgi:ABC-2 type transport system ATP-binding protein